MHGIDSSKLWPIFEEHGKKGVDLIRFWELGVEAGAIDEAIVLPQLKGDAMRMEKHRYNADRRHYNEPEKQLFQVKKKTPAGTVRKHKEWAEMDADEHAAEYRQEHRRRDQSNRKLAWMYDSATTNFGKVHARKFKQLTLGFSRPETPLVTSEAYAGN